ncbi:CDP-alcohol phosphatidyltransferase family protein [candidate division KSB1 bacterium]|nr:CDP-alcohol phosphatidyltransferase family protein [candidate division KSB1 bacterium]
MRFEILPDVLKRKYFKIVQPLINFFARYDVNPNIFSFASFSLTLIAAVFYFKGSLRIAGLFVLIGGVFDTIDGNVARAAKRETRFGALLDSTLDRYSEAVMLLGIGLFFGSKYHGSTMGAVLPLIVYMAVIGSILVSYVRARSESLGFECKVGIMQRPERVVLIGAASLFFEWLLVVVIVTVAVLTHFTVIQRLYFNRSEK